MLLRAIPNSDNQSLTTPTQHTTDLNAKPPTSKPQSVPLKSSCMGYFKGSLKRYCWFYRLYNRSPLKARHRSYSTVPNPIRLSAHQWHSGIVIHKNLKDYAEEECSKKELRFCKLLSSALQQFRNSPVVLG